ncbi:MAG: CAP domain-containing protein [Clostridium sp.]|nr:CAP domain-containing protein [Clostridium sp.]MCM1171759.1 CAP domain-containing protein [Clostridium sp.]
MNKLIPLFILPCTLALYVFDFHFCKPHPASQIEVDTEAVGKAEAVFAAETTNRPEPISAADNSNASKPVPAADNSNASEPIPAADNTDTSVPSASAEAPNNTEPAPITEGTAPSMSTPASETVTEAPVAPVTDAATEVEATTDVSLSYPSDLIAEVNRYRSSYGLSALSESSSLDYAASVRCQELPVSMSHTRPDGRSCSTVYAELGIYPSIWGENLAAGYYTSTGTASDWMSSDGHRANILNPAFTKCGVAHILCDYGYHDYWVILFSD